MINWTVFSSRRRILVCRQVFCTANENVAKGTTPLAQEVQYY